MYQKQKDEKEKKKTQKQRSLKELKLSYMIWENDLDLKIKKWREFLVEWHNVKFFIKLRWREKIYESRAVERLKDIMKKLDDVGRTQFSTPKKEAQWYSIILFSKA
jgi:translation initiation factor IF-3